MREIETEDLDELRCEVGHDGTSGWVTLSGELDLGSAQRVETALLGLRELGLARLVLDLRELDFMDSTGIALVVRWNGRARNEGFAFAVVPGGEAVQRVFRIAGIECELTVAEPPYGA